MALRGCRNGTSGAVSRAVSGARGGVRGGYVPRGTRLVRTPGGSTWNAAASSAPHTPRERARIGCSRRSTWNTPPSTAHHVPRGTRLHRPLTTFHVEHGCIGRSPRSTWNMAAPRPHDVPRGTSPHRLLSTFHVEHGHAASPGTPWRRGSDKQRETFHVEQPHGSGSAFRPYKGSGRMPYASCHCTRLVPGPAPAENAGPSAVGGRSCRQDREEL
jgi:hypothetical protein